MRKRHMPVLPMVLAFLAGPPSLMAQDAERVLAHVDSTLTAPRDFTATQRITLVNRDGREKVRVMQMYQKGTDRRLARFLAPANVRDVGFLRLADDQMYLYLPAFRRVRRIASSIKHENFMGTDLSYEDMSRARFGDDYQAVMVAPAEQGYTLTLEPRPGVDVSYRRIVMQVRSDTWVVTNLEMFNGDGRLLKTVSASNIENVDGYWFARRMEITTIKDGHRTVLDFEELEFDTGLDDDFFAQRQLKRGG